MAPQHQPPCAGTVIVAIDEGIVLGAAGIWQKVHRGKIEVMAHEVQVEAGNGLL